MAKSKSKTPELNIVIVNYQTDDYVHDLVRSITPNPRLVITIVDNSPTDSLVARLPVRPDLKYIYSGSNLGFSAGNNLGISAQLADWYLLLNSDTKTDTDTILKLLDDTKSHKALVGTCRLVGKDGKAQDNMGYFDPLARHPTNYVFARPRFACASTINSTTQCDLLTGAVMLIHHSVFDRVGYLDHDNFFMYFEDIDFSLRLHHAHISVLYHPHITITHFGGGSSSDKAVKSQSYQTSLHRYLLKHRGPIIATANRILRVLK
jgi:GT2 family glycosyltransferase